MSSVDTNPKILLQRLRELPKRTEDDFARFARLCLFACTQASITNPAQIAYIFATVEHETAGTFKPVREAYWLSEAALIRWLKKHRKRYVVDRTWGRGHVQLTWMRNYYKVDQHFGLRLALTKNPDLMLEDFELSVATCVLGMKHGWFTGKSLSDYINAKTLNLRHARRIINGNDKARKIARMATKYIDRLPELQEQHSNGYV